MVQALGSFLAVVGFLAMGVSLWGVVRGRVTWASIGSRKMAGTVLAGSFAVMGFGGAVSPQPEPVTIPAEGTAPGTVPPSTGATRAPAPTTAAAPTTTTAAATSSSSSTATTAKVAPTTPTTVAPTSSTTRPATTATTRPAATTTTTTAPMTTTTVGSGTCDPHYPGVCIPPAPPDLDCPEIPYTNFAVVGGDPHGFDVDKDGIGCEKR